jgi:hypothetical protein
MEVNMGKTTVTRISWQPSPIKITVDKKTTEECRIFKLFGQYDNK